MLGIGPLEMVIILLIALIVIGPKRLPEVLRTIGRIMGELRRTTDEVRREIMFDEDLMGVRSMLDPYTPPPRSKKELNSGAQNDDDQDDYEDDEDEMEAHALREALAAQEQRHIPRLTAAHVRRPDAGQQ